MNDDELMTAVRESFTAVHSGTAVERIVRRSRVLRHRRRIPAAAGAALTVAAAAVGVGALTSSAHPAARPPNAHLAAYTVVRQAGGGIKVTIRELHDPAALQSRLRADGVPASVIINGQPNPCRPYYLPRGTARKMVTLTREPNGSAVIHVHPAAFPKRAGVQFDSGYTHNPQVWNVAIVTASPACTGSG
jgi:hypothetical protein